jgi:hypothetical protein
MLTKKGRAEKQIFAWLKRANNSPPEKGTTDKKKGIVYSRLGWQCRREKWSWWWWWWWVRISHADHKSMWQRFGVLRVKHQKVGLFPDDGSNLFCPLMRCEWQVLSYGVCAGDTPPIFFRPGHSGSLFAPFGYLFFTRLSEPFPSACWVFPSQYLGSVAARVLFSQAFAAFSKLH